ncbi:MAG: hypothetical protein KGI38_09900 [Thaumarchaeota archaeon]|nr:hypothetical protein [Nitrososphaerota archaeon]
MEGPRTEEYIHDRNDHQLVPANFQQILRSIRPTGTPTLTRLPEPIGSYSKVRTDIDYVGFIRLCDGTKGFCPAADATGQPAISLPLGRSRSGPPIGIQFTTKFGEEATLIHLARYLEHATPWRDRTQPVHASWP